VFPLTAATGSTPVAIGSPAVNGSISSNYWPLTVAGRPNDVIAPTAIAVLASGTDVYVTAYDTSVSPTVGYIFGFSVGSGGVLTALAGSPFAAGIRPSALASDKSGTYLYATDYAGNDVLAYTIASGVLTPLAGSPFKAGTNPSAIVVDQKYSFAYVANATDSNITAYSMSSGKLTSLGTYATGLEPVALGIDPSTSHFLYSVNYLGNTVSGFELSATDGTLLDTQNSPFPSNDLPTAVAAIPHAGTGAGVP
jgi:6-phosphogluconolactonase (cycloisomerase 2 family)